MDKEKLQASVTAYVEGRINSTQLHHEIGEASYEPWEAVVNTEEATHKLEIIINEDQVVLTQVLTDEQSDDLQEEGFEAV